MNALVHGITARILMVGAVLAGLSILAAPPVLAQQTWAEVVKAAEAEGEVNVHGGPGRAYAEALGEAFAKAYPKIKINYDGGPSREVLPKIIRERQSNIFTWDVFIGGAPSLFQVLKPIGAFAPLRPVLMPEIVEDRSWRGGFDAGWMDNENKYSYGFDLTEDATVLVNWDFVKKSDLESVRDLLKPQFAGKIVAHDPRLPGEGMFTFQTFYLNFGEQFVIDMLTKQKVLYTDQRRQAAEWLVRGQYPIGFATPVEDIQYFQKQGLGKNIEVFRVGVNKMSAGSGFGMVTLMDRAPHPNAAKVYINWLLSKEGQENWKVTARNSRRMDVTLAKPELAPPANQKVVNFQAESEIPIREKLTEMAKQLIPTNTAK